MHILLIHQIFIRPQDAGGTRHYEFARYLVEHGHRVTVLAGSRSYLTGQEIDAPQREEIEHGFEVVRCHVISGVHRSFVWRTLGFLSFMASAFFNGLKIGQVDLVMGTSPPLFQAVSAWALARLKRVPFLFEVRDLWPYFAVSVGVLTNPVLIRLSEWLERFLYRGANRLVVNSPGFIEHVHARGGRRVELVPNGVDVSTFDPQADGKAFRKAHGLESKFVIMYAGAHGLSNDLGVAVEAAARLKDRSEIVFVFVGDGKEKPALQARVETLALENVIFLSPVIKADVPSTLAGADACLAILKPIEAYTTTYPNKVFDYMAAGKPVLLAIDGVIRKVVEQAGAGLAVPPGDPAALAEAVKKLAEDPAAAKRMGAAGRRQVEDHFDREKLAGDIEQIMAEMVKGG
ncbi:MAG: glycosyltransferase family 4 protein [Anaerolineales bacterium]|jgi:glycosyltransferase involved in cell wall biosynthesis